MHLVSQVRVLEEELERVSRENQELKTIIHTIRSSCDNLQAQTRMMERESEGGGESCLSHRSSAKRREMEPLRPNSYRVLVRTDPSDSSLVSSSPILLFFSNCGNISAYTDLKLCFLVGLDRQRWVPVEEVWAEDHQG